MNDRALQMPRRYETSLDRVGFAFAIGSALGGAVVLGLVALGGQREAHTLVMAWLLGAVFVALAMTAVVGPIWLVMHIAGLRRARHAMIVGAIAAEIVFVGAITQGFGVNLPAIDGRTLFYRWLSALATSAVLAVVAALIGLIMWRIAYRRHRGE